MAWLGHFRLAVAAYLRERLGLLLFLAAVLIAGVVAGALLASRLDEAAQRQLAGFLDQFLSGAATARLEPGAPEVWRWSLEQNVRTAVLLWLLGVTVVGSPGVLALVFLRGLTLGFTVGFVVAQWGAKGVLLALLAVVPANLLALPALLVLGVAALSFSWMLLRNRFRHEHLSFYQELAGYSALALAAGLVMLAAAAVESMASPLLIRAVAGMF